MVAGSRLPTTPQLRLIIKLQPVLKPINDPKEDDERSVETAHTEPLTDEESVAEEDQKSNQQQVDHHFKLETKTIEPTAVPNNKNHHKKIKPAPKNVLPPAQNKQEVSVFGTKEKLKDKNTGCALQSKQIEPSNEKEFETKEIVKTIQGIYNRDYLSRSLAKGCARI